MVLPDVNVLIAAYRVDSLEHERCRTWLTSVVNGDHAFAVSELVLSGFLRIVTNPRVFKDPATFASALEFVNTIRDLPHCVDLRPKERHWRIFTRLCQQAEVRGDLVSDAYHAALAIETGSEWITLDGDFARFPGLNWSRPPQLRRVIDQVVETR